MQKNFENIKFLYGEKSSVRLPNSIFTILSSKIKSSTGGGSIQQASFAYAYLVAISFLYKYAKYVDLDNKTYIQNTDLKELLGYNKGTKTIDRIIKKGGLLDELGLTATKKDYPIGFSINNDEKIDKIPIREFEMFSELLKGSISYNQHKDVVKNRNFEIKEPLFLTSEFMDNEYGTLYSIENTHQITLNEFMRFIFNADLSNVDFLLYGYFKSKCKGLKNDKKSLSVNFIKSEVGIDQTSYYVHLKILKEQGFIEVNHKKWRMLEQDRHETIEPNEYCFKGVG